MKRRAPRDWRFVAKAYQAQLRDLLQVVANAEVCVVCRRLKPKKHERGCPVLRPV